jgi:hypothetical protein
VVVRYDAAQLTDGRAMPLVARYFHLAKWLCYAGQTVAQGTLLGIEGNSGTVGTHLHLEFDKDVAWPMYSVQVAGSNFVLNHGRAVDTTVDPALVFWKRPGDVVLPSRFGIGWNTVSDTRLPVLPGVNEGDLTERLKRAEKTIAALETQADDLELKLQLSNTAKAGLELRLQKIKELAG